MKAREGLIGLLDNFFTQKFGKSLVIKGKPGAGKTTFALGYLEGVLESNPVCYLSSRFSDDSLFESFPWLKGVSIKNREGATQSDLTSVSTDSLQKLERMIEEGQISNSLNKGLILNIADLLPDIRSIYEFVDANYGNNPLIVIDSMEALSEKYDMSSLTLFSVLHSDLVEKSGANIITILEASENQKLEYFSDGVVSMDYYIDSDFLVRRATVEKLRGVSLGSTPVYLYTLKEGRFYPFKQNLIIYPESRVSVEAGKSHEEFEVPLDSSDLPKLTPTGSKSIPLGSVIMFHRKDNSNVVNDVVNLVKNNLIRNAISVGRGVIDATSSSYETSRILVNVMDPETMKHYITAEKSKRANPFVINLEGKSIVEDFPNDVIDFFMSSSSRPNLYFFSTDFLMFTYGPDFFGDLVNLVNGIRPTGATVIIADDEYYGKISHYSNISIHFKEVSGYVLMNSAPRISYAAIPEYDKSHWPDIKLFDIV